MKKALLLVLAIIAVCFLIANADYLSDFLNTMMTGALVPIIISIVLMIGRHLVQAESYNAAFEAVGHKTGFWHNVVLIFSLVFINTFCLFSGATGVAFIIDDAHREGCDAGQSTGGAILSQIGYFAAVFVISVIGFLTMWISGHMNTLFLIGGLVLAGVLVILSSLFFIGHFKPRMLFRVFLLIEKAINKVIGLFKKSLKTGWGRSMAHSFVNTSDLLAKNPLGSIITVAYASFSAILNMACLVAIGYAFGFENVESLVAAFAVAAISVILSPTPQGVGVVEAMIVAILTAYGCSVATAAAIALVYRGIMFWIPFCIGAVLLSQSGFFRSKKSDTVKQKHKDIAWIYYRRCEHRVCFQPEPFHAVYNAYLVDRYELAYGGCSAYRELAFPDGLLDRACDAIPHGLGVDHRLARTDRGLGVPVPRHMAGGSCRDHSGFVDVLEEGGV